MARRCWSSAGCWWGQQPHRQPVVADVGVVCCKFIWLKPCLQAADEMSRIFDVWTSAVTWAPMCWHCLNMVYSITTWAASVEGTSNCLHKLEICFAPCSALFRWFSGQEDLSITKKFERVVTRISSSQKHSARPHCLCSSHLHSSHQWTSASSV